MGNCCVTPKEKPVQNGINFAVSQYRNVRHSPQWGFRWDNRTHIEDIMDNSGKISVHDSSGNIGNIGTEVKGSLGSEKGTGSGGAGPSEIKNEVFEKSKLGGKAIDNSLASTSCQEGKSSNIISSPTQRTHPSSSTTWSQPSNPSKKSCLAQISRQPSGSLNNELSHNNNSFDSGTNTSNNSNWTAQTFSELVASSQRAKSSFETEKHSFIDTKSASSDSRDSSQLQICKICLKLLKERSPWSAQKIVSSNELSVAAVLDCSHVYHADCLERTTPEADIYDPPCPVCTHGEKSLAKMLGKIESRSKKGKGSFPAEKLKSYSVKGSFSKTPFLRRHLSHGSRPLSSLSEGESSRRKGLLGRYLRD